MSISPVAGFAWTPSSMPDNQLDPPEEDEGLEDDDFDTWAELVWQEDRDLQGLLD